MAAAVAVIEVDDAEPAVLLIRRALRANDPWSGHWALPGGRRQRDDVDDLATCVREVQEEVGLVLPRQTCRAVLPPAEAGRHAGRPITVAPFLFRLAVRPALRLDAREVASACWCPLATLRDLRRHGRAELGQDRPSPMILLDTQPLWGFTYRVLMHHLGLSLPTEPDRHLQ